MGSDPTLDQQPAIRWGQTGDQQDDRHGLGGHAELLEHLQTPAAAGGHEFGDWPASEIANGFAGDLLARHRHDHIRLGGEFAHTHPERTPTLSWSDGERAFDRLNPDFGVPADQHDPYGRRAVRDREAALSLGIRIAVASSRENDRNPVSWLTGQDYRAADAIRHARTQLVRTHQPERVGAER
jgi:hypothetical protein